MANELENVDSVQEFLYKTTDPRDPMQLWEAERYESQIILGLTDHQADQLMVYLSIVFERGKDYPKDMPNPYIKPKE